MYSYAIATSHMNVLSLVNREVVHLRSKARAGSGPHSVAGRGSAFPFVMRGSFRMSVVARGVARGPLCLRGPFEEIPVREWCHCVQAARANAGRGNCSGSVPLTVEPTSPRGGREAGPRLPLAHPKSSYWLGSR